MTTLVDIIYDHLWKSFRKDVFYFAKQNHFVLYFYHCSSNDGGDEFIFLIRRLPSSLHYFILAPGANHMQWWDMSVERQK